MPFLPNIPQANDQLSVSQGNILNNFTVLGAIAGNTNPSSSSINSTSGFNWLYLSPQGATPPAGSSFAAGNIGLYSALNASTGVNELYINKANAAQIPATASLQAANGWTYFPSGLIMQWGTAVANGNASVNFPMVFPNNAYSISFALTDFTSGAQTVNVGLTMTAFNATSFQVNGSRRDAPNTAVSVTFYWTAIGN